jgi:hypothetical protein
LIAAAKSRAAKPRAVVADANVSGHAGFRQRLFGGFALIWQRFVLVRELHQRIGEHCPNDVGLPVMSGSTVYWESEGFPGYIIVAIGNFADPNFPAPTIAVWEESRYPWVSLPSDTPAMRMPKQG